MMVADDRFAGTVLRGCGCRMMHCHSWKSRGALQCRIPLLVAFQDCTQQLHVSNAAAPHLLL